MKNKLQNKKSVKLADNSNSESANMNSFEEELIYVANFFILLGIKLESCIKKDDTIDLVDLHDKIKTRNDIVNIISNSDIFQMSILEKVLKTIR